MEIIALIITFVLAAISVVLYCGLLLLKFALIITVVLGMEVIGLFIRRDRE